MGKPAARLGDPTAHGGVVTVGCPTVLIGGQPAARIGDMHVCPMLNPGVPPPPHVGSPITLGSPMVLIGGMPAARMGDMAACAGPPDTIVGGCPTVLIGEAGGGGGGGGAGAVAAAKMGAHSALVGEPGPEAVGPHWIEYQFVDSAGNPVTGVSYEFSGVDGNTETGCLQGNGIIKRGGIPNAGDCSVILFLLYNAKWSKKEAKVGDVVKLSADVEGYEDGSEAMFKIFERDNDGSDKGMAYIKAKVKGKKVEAEWTYKFREDSDDYISEEDEKKGYSYPEYYFIVYIEKDKARSNFLRFQDWVEVQLKDEDDNPFQNEEYIIYFSNGEIRKGKLDGNGYKKIENVPPRSWHIEFPNLKIGNKK